MADLPAIQKVTALITRDTPRGRDLLVFYRPDDSMIQLPAGTVEDGESPDDAVLREVLEEAGLSNLRTLQKLGGVEQPLEYPLRVLLETHALCDAPDGTCDGYLLRRGFSVYLQEETADWSRVVYYEYHYDAAEEKMTLDWEKTGWLPSRILTDHMIRYFYHLTPTEPTPERWIVEDGGDGERILELYWTPLDGDPVIVPKQRWWVDQFRNELREVT